MNIVKPAPIEALKAFKVFVKLSQIDTSCQKLPTLLTLLTLLAVEPNGSIKKPTDGPTLSRIDLRGR